METTAVPADKAHRKAWVKFKLELKGFSLGALARKHGLSRTAATKALRVPYPRMEAAIAETIGIKPEVIWPERYSNSLPIQRRRSAFTRRLAQGPNRPRNTAGRANARPGRKS